MPRARISRLRQLIRETEAARVQHVDAVVGTDKVIVGSLVMHGRRCGRPGCHCATGEKHYSKVLSRSEGAGKVRHLYVPAGDEVDVAVKAGRYRRFRQARAELVKLAKQSIDLIDRLQDAVTEPYPPPNRPRGRRQRARKGGRGR